jgi:hypothetical protein
MFLRGKKTTAMMKASAFLDASPILLYASKSQLHFSYYNRNNS